MRDEMRLPPSSRTCRFERGSMGWSDVSRLYDTLSSTSLPRLLTLDIDSSRLYDAFRWSSVGDRPLSSSTLLCATSSDMSCEKGASSARLASSFSAMSRWLTSAGATAVPSVPAWRSAPCTAETVDSWQERNEIDKPSSCQRGDGASFAPCLGALRAMPTRLATCFTRGSFASCYVVKLS